MKRLFTFFFSLMSAYTFSAYAAIVDGTCGTNLTWTLNTKDSLTISGTGEMTDYSSPSSVPWYDYRSYIKYVTIEDGLTSIGSYAFLGCSGLRSITIPNSVTSIGDEAFCYCDGLRSVTLGNSVTSIGNFAFGKCFSLTSITIPNSVTSIGHNAFAGCGGLTSATLGNSVTSIGEWAFSDCSSLTSITIPNSVTSIGYDAFSGCYSLTSVVWNAKNCADTNDEWGIFGAYESNLISVIFGENVEHIPSFLCSYLEKLKSVVIPSSVKTIGDGAFYRCTSLNTITVEALTPPTLNQYPFEDDPLSLCYIPCGTLDAYQASNWESYVGEFVEQCSDDSGDDGDMDKDLTIVFSDRDNNQISAQTVTLRVPVAPEIAGFTFLYWKTIDARVDDVITLQAVYESNTPTAAPEVYVNPSNPAQKLIRNGQVYILHEEKMYTISGQVVK